MPRMLGDAFVVINPDTRNFRASADRQIKTALAGLKYEVPIGVDASGTMAAIRLLQQRMRQLGLADFLDVNIPVGKLVAQVQLIKRLLNQAHVADALEVNLDQASLARQLRALRTAAQSVTATVPVEFDIGKMPTLGPVGSLSEKVRIDTSAASAALAGLGKLADGVRGRMGYLDTGLVKTSLDSIAMARSIASGNNALAIMSGSAARAGAAVKALADMGADLRQLDGALKDTAGIYAELAAADKMLAAGTALQTDMLAKEAAAVRLNAVAFRELTPEVAAVAAGGGGLAAALRAAQASFSSGALWTGRWGGALTATIPVIGATVRSMAGWHIILDLIIEGLIAVGLAAAAMAAGLAAAAPAAHNLFDWLQSVHTVSTALGQVITPMTGQFQALSKAMAPQVIEAFGGALTAVTGKTGGLAQVAARVVTMFDDWIAKIDLWAASQGGFTKLLQSGIGYLAQFAGIIGTVVKAIANLLTKDPGIARFLLDFVGGVAKLLLMFSNLPAPIVTAVLALHGFYLWGSVLLPVVLRLTGYLLGLGAALLETAANPFFWVAAAVVGLTALAYESGQATSGAKAFVAAIDTGLANDTATQAILGIAAAVGQLTTQIQASSGPINVMKQWNAQSESLSGGFQRLSFNMRATGAAFGKAFGDIPQTLSSWGALARTARDFGHAIADVFSSNSGASIAAGNNVKLYEDKIRSLIAAQGVLFRVAGELLTGNNNMTTSVFTLAQAFAVEDLAGVKAGDSLALANQKVSNLLKGYEAMSIQGPLLAASVNAVTFATLQQDSKVTALTGAWTNFISMVSGGLDKFAQFELQISTINQALTGIAPAAQKGGTALGGLSDASLKADSAFVLGVTNANNLINALTLQASAAGLGAKGTDMLTAATKDAVAQMIPMAGHSAAAQAALIALAQQGGFPAGQSFQQLQKWVLTASGTMDTAGKAGGPAAQLNAIMNTLATTSDNLTTDVKNLSVALGTNLTQAESAAILLAKGGVKPFNDFANAVFNTGVSSDATRKAAIRLGDEFLALANNNVPAAKTQFESFAIGGLGLTKTQADALWQDVLNHGVPALNNLGSTADSIHQNHLAPLGVGVDTVAGKVANLSKYLLAVPANVNTNIHATASGSGNIAFTQTIPGVSVGPSSSGLLGFHAAGGKITGGTPGRDSVLGMLMPGEVVVPTDMVDAGLVDHLRGRLPGFASGGRVSGSIGNPSGPEQWMTGKADAFMQAAENQFMKAAIAEFQAAMAALATGNPAGIIKYAESFLGKIPYVWGGTSLSSAGADCSGFTQAVYGHFGIRAPRTSEAQGAWVQRGFPTPGGLAFYHSPPGGPDPGHVAIIAGGGQVISQGGGMGPKMEGLSFLPLLFTGTPPGGFPGSSGGAGSPGGGTPAQNAALARQLMPSWGSGMEWFNWNQLEMAEAGWNQFARNPSSGAYGIPQALPPSKMGSAANPPQSNPAAQIRWMIQYIQQTYGDPINANAHELAFHWYKAGGAVGKALDRTQRSAGLAAGGRIPPLPPMRRPPSDPMAGAAAQIRAVAALRAKLAWEHGHEVSGYRGLASAFWHGPARYRTPGVRAALQGLWGRQATEQGMYKRLAGAGLTGGNLDAFAGAARAELAAAKAPALSRLPGGHPGWAAGLRSWLGMEAAAGKAKVPPALSGLAALFAATRGSGSFTISNGPGSEWQYGTGLSGSLVPQTFDKGGYLRPGMNLAWNGTGRPEPVGGGPMTVTLEVTGSGSGTFDAFLLKWLKQNVRVRGGGSVQHAFGVPGVR